MKKVTIMKICQITMCQLLYDLLFLFKYAYPFQQILTERFIYLFIYFLMEAERYFYVYISRRRGLQFPPTPPPTTEKKRMKMNALFCFALITILFSCIGMICVWGINYFLSVIFFFFQFNLLYKIIINLLNYALTSSINHLIIVFFPPVDPTAIGVNAVSCVLFYVFLV